MSRFRTLDTMLAFGRDRVVTLRFTNIECVSLYVHSCVLSNWSRVLANVLEDAHSTQPVADAAAEPAGAEPAAATGHMRHQSIPVDDADSSAWEDALSLMYPAVPLFQVTWGNAARLLLLADKYDMPAVAEHVRIFLDTPREAFAPTAGGAAAAPAGPRRLEAQLSSGSTPGLPNVFEWLQVTDKCGLEQHAQTCIQYIIQHQLPIPAGLVSSIQPHHAEALFNAMQQALRNVQALLQQAALPSQEYACACCGNRWHQLPRSGQLPSPSGRRQLSQQAAACVHCGEDVQQRLQGSLAAGAAAEADADHGLSESLGTTDEGADADDTDDEEEGDEDESDEAMSQDSSSQGADDDADELGGSEEDAMQSGSGASGSEEEEASSEGDTDDSSLASGGEDAD